MKRKLDENSIPKAIDTSDVLKQPSNFNVLGLEPRLLQAVAQQNFITPTLVQSRAIPLVLEGKDVLGMMSQFLRKDSVTDLLVSARSKTGSGKTAAYILPILQSILQKTIVCNPSYLQFFPS